MKDKFCDLLLDNDSCTYETALRFREFLHNIFAANSDLYFDLFIRKEPRPKSVLPAECQSIDEFCQAGLIERNRDDGIVSNVMVHRNLMDIEMDIDGENKNPAPEWFIATDWPDIPPDDGEIGEWAVFPIHYESIYLLRTLEEDNKIRSPEGKKVIDIFCGSGIFGIYAALKGADEVVCSDISKRALAFTRFNAILNNVGDEIQLSKSDIFEHQAFVRLRKKNFDLIIANPPFEPVPDGSSYYRHSDGGPFGQYDVQPGRILTAGPVPPAFLVNAKGNGMLPT